LANAASGSSKNITPNREMTASNGSPSPAHVVASATTHSIGAGGDPGDCGSAARAASTIAAETSTPTARPSGPTRAAAS